MENIELTLEVPQLRNLLNKLLIFVNKSKVTLQPVYSSVFLEGHTAKVFNGEAGADIDMPFEVPRPLMFLPYDVAQFLSYAKDDAQVRLTIKEKSILFQSGRMKATVHLLDPATFPLNALDDKKDIEIVSVPGFYQKVKNACFACGVDATLPLLQGVRFTKNGVATTDQRRLYSEAGPCSAEFVVPLLMVDEVCRLGVEPLRVGLSDSRLYLYYTDMVVYGLRLADDRNYPDVCGVIAKLTAMADIAEVTFDKDALNRHLEALLSLNNTDHKAFKLSARNNQLHISNLVEQSGETEADITIDCTVKGELDGFIFSGPLFKQGVERFTSFVLKEDGKRIIFVQGDTRYVLARRLAA